MPRPEGTDTSTTTTGATTTGTSSTQLTGPSPHGDGQPTRGPRGPRGSRGEIRDRITAAALRSFADHGFDGASTRAIARDADCDPALVRYYFSSKQRLFEQVTQRPPELDAQLATMVRLPQAGRAAYLADLVENCWDDPATGSYWRALIRSAASDPTAARQVEDLWDDFVSIGVLDGVPHPERDGSAPDEADEDAYRRQCASRTVLALSAIMGMLAANHLWSSRRVTVLESGERAVALSRVLGGCFGETA